MTFRLRLSRFRPDDYQTVSHGRGGLASVAAESAAWLRGGTP